MLHKQFPLNGISAEMIHKRLKPGDNYIAGDRVFLGYPQSVPHHLGREIYKQYLDINENHVGTFTNMEHDKDSTRNMEKELIEMLGDLYGDNEADGYVTSGGTEGNIMGVWIARNYLAGEVCLLKTSLTHQSIDKACNMLQIKYVIDIRYNERFQMSVIDLRNAIIDKIHAGVHKFIVVVTVGYTMTGTADPVKEIGMILGELEKEYQAQFYIHVDAAIGGLVFPFLSGEEFAFQCRYVYSLSVDPHKMGYVPFSAGIFMCRKGMQRHIEVPINYAKEITDKTLISSRNAAAAVSCWAVFQYLGRKGFSVVLKDLIRLKEFLIKELQGKNLARIISDPGTNMLCLHFLNHDGGRLTEAIEKKYVLDGFFLYDNGADIMCYKIYLMPHVTIDSLKNFVSELKGCYGNTD